MDAFFAASSSATIPSCAASRSRSAARAPRRRRGGELRGAQLRRALGHALGHRARLCPDLIFGKARFEAYREVSQQIRAIFADYTPHVEPLSLDEAYLDVTEDLKGIGIATRIAEVIRPRIRAETGLTASAGVLQQVPRQARSATRTSPTACA